MRLLKQEFSGDVIRDAIYLRACDSMICPVERCLPLRRRFVDTHSFEGVSAKLNESFVADTFAISNLSSRELT